MGEGNGFGPEIIEVKSAKDLKKKRIRVMRGELEQLKGAWGEEVFIRKSKGDFSPQRREIMEGVRRRRAKESIKRVKEGRILGIRVAKRT